MEIAYLLEKSLNEETFYVGIIVGLIICFCFSIFKKDRTIKEREKALREISIISLLINSMHSGDKVLIEDYFHETKAKNIVYSARYNAWKAFIGLHINVPLTPIRRNKQKIYWLLGKFVLEKKVLVIRNCLLPGQ